MKVAIIEKKEAVAGYLWEMIASTQQDVEPAGTFPDFPGFIRYLKENEQPDLLLLDLAQFDNKVLHWLQSDQPTFPLLFTNSFKHNGEVQEKGMLQRRTVVRDELHVRLQQVRLAGNIIQQVSTLPVAERERPAAGRWQQRFLVRNKQKLRSVRVEDIAVFLAEERLNFLMTKDGKKFVVPYSIATLSQSLLCPDRFFKVNRSTIISFSDIKDMFSYFGGRIKIVLHTPVEKEIIVSRDRVGAFRKWLGE